MFNFAEKLRENRAVAVFLTVSGLFFALLFLFGAVMGLIANEQEALRHTKTLTEGEKLVISTSLNQIEANNEDHLVHLSGEVLIDETLIDPLFQVNIYNAIRLRRVVEMYQWQEKQFENELGNIEYIYEKIWYEHFIDFNEFKHPRKYYNPAKLLESDDFDVKKAPVKLGAFTLSDDLIENMAHYQHFPMTEMSFWKAEDKLQSLLQKQELHFKELHFYEENFYVGNNPTVPQIGDLRIKFEVIQPGIISVIAKQVNSNLVSYQTQTGDDIELFELGVVSAEDMFWNERISLFPNQSKPRFLGFFFLFLGIYIIFGVLWLAKTSLPFLGNSSNTVGWLFSLIMAAALTLSIIGVIWKNYSPVTAGILFVIVVAILFLLIFARRKEPKLKKGQKSLKNAYLIPEKMVPKKMDE
jgi:hypothetical protein